MRFFYLTLLVFKIMKEKPQRVFLTTFGIFIGIFTFVFFQFAGNGLSAGVENQISSLGLNTITLSPADAPPQTGPPSGAGVTENQLREVERVARGYNYVTGQLFFPAVFEYGREESVIVTQAFPDENLNDIAQDIIIDLAQGRNIRPGDRGSVVLGAKVATETFERELQLGNSISFNQNGVDRTFRVVGIFEQQDDLFVDFSMRMSFSDIQEISGQDTYTNIRVSYPQGVDLEVERERLNSHFNRRNQPRIFSISSPQQTLEQINQIFSTLTIVIGFISAIALVVGGINVMNTMYSNVLERINEISVQKAMGATNEQIIFMYLVESVTLSLIGAIIGFLSSYYVAQALSAVIRQSLGFSFPVEFSMTFFLIVCGVTVVFGGFFGSYPAYLAAKVNPADNLRDE